MRRVQMAKGSRSSSSLEAMAPEVPQWLALQPTSFPLASLLQLAGMHNEPVLRRLEHYKQGLLEQHTSTVKTELQLQEMQRRFMEAITWRQTVAAQIVEAMAERHSSARLLLCCLVELQRGVTLLAEGEADPESEFALSNPALVPYLRGLAELCYIGTVCVQAVVGPGVQHFQGLAHDLQSRVALLSRQLAPAFQQCGIQVKQLDASQAGALKCALSGIPIESQHQVAMWNSAPLHVSVANLWSHKVASNPPVVRF